MIQKVKSKIRKDAEIANASKEMLHGLMQLSNSPHYRHVGSLIRLIKGNILMLEFGFPASDPVKNSLYKEYMKGIDRGLTILANTIKNAGILADELEEQHE